MDILLHNSTLHTRFMRCMFIIPKIIVTISKQWIFLVEMKDKSLHAPHPGWRWKLHHWRHYTATQCCKENEICFILPFTFSEPACLIFTRHTLKIKTLISLIGNCLYSISSKLPCWSHWSHNLLRSYRFVLLKNSPWTAQSFRNSLSYVTLSFYIQCFITASRTHVTSAWRQFQPVPSPTAIHNQPSTA